MVRKIWRRTLFQPRLDSVCSRFENVMNRTLPLDKDLSLRFFSLIDLAAVPSFVFVLARREGLSQALGNDPKAPLPRDNVFPVQNYHQGSSAQDPGESEDPRNASLSLLEVLVLVDVPTCSYDCALLTRICV